MKNLFYILNSRDFAIFSILSKPEPINLLTWRAVFSGPLYSKAAFPTTNPVSPNAMREGVERLPWLFSIKVGDPSFKLTVHATVLVVPKSMPMA